VKRVQPCTGQEPIVSGRSIAARYPDRWPAEMRADVVAAMFDYETTGQLWKAIARGEPAMRERRTTVNHAMKSCRRCWNVAARLHPKDVPVINPFAKMGLAGRPDNLLRFFGVLMNVTQLRQS
jgi:hypothetical protein